MTAAGAYEEQWQLETDSTASPPTAATVTLHAYTPAARAKRVAVAVVGGVVVAALAIPIPVVHFVCVPLALFGGIGAGIRLAGVRESLRGVHGACPRCGREQDFFVGTGLFGYRLPMTLACDHCSRESRLVRRGA